MPKNDVSQTVARADSDFAEPEVKIRNADPTQAEHDKWRRMIRTITQQKRNGGWFGVWDNLEASVVNLQAQPHIEALTREFTDVLHAGTLLRNTIEELRPPESEPLRDLEGEVQIGLTRLVIPPEKIRVLEVPQHIEVGGLRTQTATVIKTGRGRIQIEMDLVFEGERMINRSLRELLAQFRGYPYVPVVSRYLTRIVQPKLQRPPNSGRGGERVLADKLKQQRELAVVAVGEAKIRALNELDIIQITHPDFARAVSESETFQTAQQAFVNSGTLNEVQIAATNLTDAYLGAARLTKATVSVQVARLAREAINAFDRELNTLRESILDLNRIRFSEIHLQVGGLIDPERGIIPCTLDQIQIRTVPGHPRMLRAKLFLNYFNPIPFGGILQYRDILGAATTDPQQAIFMQAQIRKWMTPPSSLPELPSEEDPFGDDGQIRDDAKFNRLLQLDQLAEVRDQEIVGGEFRIAYATPAMDLERHGDRKARVDEFSSIEERLKDQRPRWRTLDLGPERQGVTVRYISSTLSNRLAVQPIPGELYGTSQYIGSKPARVVVSLAVTDQDVLSDIHYMKMANQTMSLLGVRAWRRPEVHIRNPVINMMGIYTAQIDDMVTESESPNTTVVTLTLAEHRVDPQDRQPLQRPMLFSVQKLKEAILYLKEHAARYLDKRSVQTLRTIRRNNPLRFTQLIAQINAFRATAGQSQITTEQVAKHLRDQEGPEEAHELAAFRLLFGETVVKAETGPEGEPLFERTAGILESSIVAKAFFLDAQTAKEPSGARSVIARRIRSYFALNPALVGEAAARQVISQWTTETQPGFSLRNFTDDHAGLIAAHLYRSPGNALDNVEFDSDRGTVAIRDAAGEDKTNDITILLLLTQAILQNHVVPPTGLSLRETVLGRGVTVQDFFATIPDSTSFLYADLSLPSYRDALGLVLRAIDQNRARLGRKPLGTDIASLNDPATGLSEEERALVQLFVPTYRQLGKIPNKEGVGLDDFAYDLDDTVVPDFPFYGRDTQALSNQMQQLIDRRRRDGNDSLERRRRPEESRTVGGVPYDPLRQRENQALIDSARIGEAERGPTDAQRSDVASIALDNQDVLISEAYGPGRFRHSPGDFGVNTPEQMKRIFDAASAGREDAHLTLRKCFPTFRLFFIEEDTREGVWRALDDVYGFNSVIEINVTRHKYQLDVAEVVLNNLEGVLETDTFSTAQRDTPEGKVEYDPRVSTGFTAKPTGSSETAGLTEANTGERLLRKFPLREGTRIMIQLGYHSRPDYLETVFTGKIAEIRFGDMIHLVAQSYLQELLFPVAQNLPTETLTGVVEAMLNVPTVEHFGRWTPFTHGEMTRLEAYNANATDTRAMLLGIAARLSGRRGDLTGQFLAHPKLRNVFTSKYRSWWTRTAGEFFEESWEVGGGQSTAWDVIQDIINYTPGYVAAVVPYDFEATLFVGRPEQPYFWTDGLRTQEAQYIRSRQVLQAQVKEAGTVLFRKFLKSRFYHGGEDKVLTYQDVVDRVAIRDGLPRTTTDGRLRYQGELSGVGGKIGFEIALLADSHPMWTAFTESLVRRFGVLSASAAREPERSGGTGGRLGTALDSVYAPDITFQVLENTASRDAGQLLEEIFDLVEATDVDWAVIAEVLVQSIQGGVQLAGRTVERNREFAPTFEVRTPEVTTGQLERIANEGGDAVIALQFLHKPIEFFSKVYDGSGLFARRIDEALGELDRRDAFSAADVTPTQINRLATFLEYNRSTIPVVFQAIREYLRADPLATSIVRHEFNTKKWPLNPRMRPFRQYHLLSTYEDIMENQMSCTRGAMWNGVTIANGKDTPLELWSDDGIVADDRIMKFFQEPNADTDIYNVGQSESTPLGDFTMNKYVVGFSRLAQGLRFMYRGQLVCRGRPEIKPWDVTYVYDHYNHIYGPVEIERVTHHFSAETGFVTTVVPHMLAIPNNHLDHWQTMLQNWKLGAMAVGSSIAVGAVATGLLLLLTPVGLAVGVGIGLGAALAGKTVGDFFVREATGTDILGLFAGVGRMGGLKTPVKIIPLNRMGVPWTAALRGWGRNPKDSVEDVLGLVFERIKGATLDIKAGWDETWRRYDTFVSGYDRLVSNETFRERRRR